MRDILMIMDDNSIFISQVLNHIYTHVYQNKIEWDLSIEEETKDAVIQHTQTTNNIIDITVIIKGKNQEKFEILRIKCLWTTIDIGNLLKDRSIEIEVIIDRCSRNQV